MTYFFSILTNTIVGDIMDLTKTFIIIPRSIFALVILFLITKLIGRKQVSELSLFDYVIGISIGNFAAEMILNFEIEYFNGVVAVVTFGVMAYLVSIVTMKSIVLRRILIGTPVVVIQNGKILEQSMKKLRIDINDLLEQIRNSGYFDLNEVEYALMETNGKLSILPKSEYHPVINKDMNLKVEKASLCANAIIDGHIMKNNLKNIGKDEKWLLHELKVKGYSDIAHILLATIDNNDKVMVYEKTDTKVKMVLE